MPRLTRAGMYLSLTVIALLAFIQLSPLTYGTLMTPDQCNLLATRINPVKIPDPGYAGVAKGTHIPLIQPTLKLECSTWAQHVAQTLRDHSGSGTFAQFKERVELHLPKPIPRKRSPVLEPIFPDKDTTLPRANVFMTPCQRPPQLWEVNEQEGKPNAFQRQQMQYIFRKIEKEAKVEAERRKRLEEEGAEVKKQRVEAETKEHERVRAEKERVEKERQKTEAARIQRLERDRLDREIEAKFAAEEKERQYQIEQKAFVVEQARRERIETEKQQKVQEIADQFRKEAEKKEATRKAQQEQEEAERQRLNHQNAAFDATAKAAEVIATSKAAERVERVATMPSRQEFREMFFKRAEKMRQAKVNGGFQFENGRMHDAIPSELRVLNALLSAAGHMGGGSIGGQENIAELEALSASLASFGDLDTQGLGQQQQQDLLKEKVGTGSAATKPVKKTLPKPEKKAPVGNVENLESLIDALQQAREKAPAKPKAAPAPQPQQQPDITQELLDQVAKLEQLTNGKATPDELLEQLGGLVNVMAKQQVKLGFRPEDLANLQGGLENLLEIVKEQEEVEKIKTKRKW